MWESRNHSNLVIPICIVFLFKLCLCNGGVDSLPRGQSLSGRRTLISKGGIFELGFFSPNGSSSPNIYLGIWYKHFPDKTIVWVANREVPLPSITGSRLEIDQTGNLGLFHDYDIIWSTNLSNTLVVPDTVEAVLLDSGNLILRDGSRMETKFWQTFDHPTHIWLPGAPLGFDNITGGVQSLVSWKTPSDPSPGLFSLEMSQSKELVLQWNRSTPYWSSGTWNGDTFRSVLEISFMSDFSFVSNESMTYCNYTNLNKNVRMMFAVNPSGHLEQLVSNQSHHNWKPIFAYPKWQDEIFASCGAFGVLRNGSSTYHCTCLPGFAPISGRSNDLTDRSSVGCFRKSCLQCENGTKDGFLEISVTKTAANPKPHPATSHKGCRNACLQECFCTAYAFSGRKCSLWDGSLLDLQNISVTDKSSGKIQLPNIIIYLKVSDSEVQKAKGRKKILEVIISVAVPLVVLVSGGFIGFFYTRKTKQKETKKALGEDLLSYDFNDGAVPTNDGTIVRKVHSTEFDLPIFNYSSVLASANNFSLENKLGEGGFGPVYQGKLLNGQEIALKRLSKKSKQGLEEFRNEIVLIAKLQHRNLVRILGCCIDPDESVLIYEYMPNRSLDYFLFDSNKSNLLNWATRARIIQGISQGLLYLHEHSRIHVIHRDLKASNILLDNEMNPKISDFGMARIFQGNVSETYTNKIVGTYGYMAPEYVLKGLFSIKSDVFSFGVLVLEIVSGKKNTGFHRVHSVNLLGHAWELWNSNRGYELMDPASGCPQVSEVLRYINIGLLCVQENPDERPNMPCVVSMLSTENGYLPVPKHPAFYTTKGMSNSNLTPLRNVNGGSDDSSVNGITVSSIEPR